MWDFWTLAISLFVYRGRDDFAWLGIDLVRVPDLAPDALVDFGEAQGGVIAFDV